MSQTVNQSAVSHTAGKPGQYLIYCRKFLPLDKKIPGSSREKGESGLTTMVYYCILHTLSL